jgi:hypothetical protein
MLFTPTADHHQHDGFFDHLVQRWHAWKDRRDSLAALESCGRGEVARIAHDLSLSPGELRSLAAKGPDSADLLYRRMDELGLDRGSVEHDEPRAMWDMQKACSLCSSKGRCRHDFARGAAASAWQPYCPNDDMLSAFVAGGAHRLRRGSTSVRAAAIDHDRRGLHGSLLGLLLVTLAWLVLLATPPANQHSNLRRLAPVAPHDAVAAATPTIACLDGSCLTAQQHAAIRDLRTVQQQGWIASSADQIASLPRNATVVQSVQSGEALTCRSAGGATYYGFMFQGGCSTGAIEAGKLDGFKECRPMAGGGVCLLK